MNSIDDGVVHKQIENLQTYIETATSLSKAIINGNEQFNIEAAKARVLAREAVRE